MHWAPALPPPRLVSSAVITPGASASPGLLGSRHAQFVAQRDLGQRRSTRPGSAASPAAPTAPSSLDWLVRASCLSRRRPLHLAGNGLRPVRCRLDDGGAGVVDALQGDDVPALARGLGPRQGGRHVGGAGECPGMHRDRRRGRHAVHHLPAHRDEQLLIGRLQAVVVGVGVDQRLAVRVVFVAEHHRQLVQVEGVGAGEHQVDAHRVAHRKGLVVGDDVLPPHRAGRRTKAVHLQLRHRRGRVVAVGGFQLADHDGPDGRVRRHRRLGQHPRAVGRDVGAHAWTASR